MTAASGADVVAAARVQLGVPWVHQARLPGVAVDCIGLVICIARSLGLLPADWDIGGYSRAPDGLMLETADLHMHRLGAPELGAVVIVACERDPQHMGIVADYRHGGWSIIHASNAAQPARVVETRLMFTRAMSLCAYYRLPGVEV